MRAAGFSRRYVLRGNTFLRISVGGIRDEAERIEKSQALAR